MSRRELLIARASIAILLGLVATHVAVWAKNLSSAPAPIRLSLHDGARVLDVMHQSSTFQKRYGCHYVIRDRMQGGTLTGPRDLAPLRWYFQHLSRVDLKTVDQALPVELTAAVSAVNRGLEAVRCHGMTFLVGDERSSNDHLIVDSPIGRMVLAESEYRQVIDGARSEGATTCNLLDEGLWNIGANAAADVSWSSDLRIRIKRAVKRYYLKTGGAGGFDSAPDNSLCSPKSGSAVAVLTDIEASRGIGVLVYVIQYGSDGRITHTSFDPRKTPIRLVRLTEATTSVRYAIRLAGQGAVSFKSFRVVRPSEGP